VGRGRLLDFLAHGAFAERFAGLRRFVLGSLHGDAQPARALLVNLNLRAVTAGGAESLVERQLLAMLTSAIVPKRPSCSRSCKPTGGPSSATLRRRDEGGRWDVTYFEDTALTASWQLQHQHGYAPLVTRVVIEKSFEVSTS
jgi:hypothetical protein